MVAERRKLLLHPGVDKMDRGNKEDVEGGNALYRIKQLVINSNKLHSAPERRAKRLGPRLQLWVESLGGLLMRRRADAANDGRRCALRAAIGEGVLVVAGVDVVVVVAGEIGGLPPKLKELDPCCGGDDRKEDGVRPVSMLGPCSSSTAPAANLRGGCRCRSVNEELIGWQAGRLAGWQCPHNSNLTLLASRLSH